MECLISQVSFCPPSCCHKIEWRSSCCRLSWYLLSWTLLCFVFLTVYLGRQVLLFMKKIFCSLDTWQPSNERATVAWVLCLAIRTKNTTSSSILLFASMMSHAMFFWRSKGSGAAAACFTSLFCLFVLLWLGSGLLAASCVSYLIIMLGWVSKGCTIIPCNCAFRICYPLLFLQGARKHGCLLCSSTNLCARSFAGSCG